MLITQNLSYRYNTETDLSYPDLNLGRDQTHLILGASGSGKSSWMQLITGLRTPSKSSQLSLDGTILHTMNSTLRDRHRAQYMGVIYQEPVFIESINVLDNLLLAQRLASGQAIKSRAESLAASLDIVNLLHRKPRQLSTGQRQRAAIARALIHEPKLILADEPSSALDNQRAEDLNSILRNQAKEQNSILVIITHDERLIKSNDHIIHLENQHA